MYKEAAKRFVIGLDQQEKEFESYVARVHTAALTMVDLAEAVEASAITQASVLKDHVPEAYKNFEDIDADAYNQQCAELAETLKGINHVLESKIEEATRCLSDYQPLL